MYVLLGSNGNITSKAARMLLSQGKRVRVVGRNAERLESLWLAGAELAVGDIADPKFLATAIRGAEALYAMIPPQYSSSSPLVEYRRIGESIAKAISAAGIERVVNLSSVGAHLATGTGPIVGLHEQEDRLNQIDGVKILHLRPSYFFENHFNAIAVLKSYGIYSDMIAPHLPIPAIAARDIAAVVARELLNPRVGAEKQCLHLRGPNQHTPVETASILGRAIGKPDLKYVQADPAKAKAGMVRHGISPAMADLFEELSNAYLRDEFFSEIFAGPTEVTTTSLDEFALIFEAAYGRVARDWHIDRQLSLDCLPGEALIDKTASATALHN